VFDVFDTHFKELRSWSHRYTEVHASDRCFLALNGNYLALMFSGLAQYLLLRPNMRVSQQHYTLTSTDTKQVMVFQNRPGTWSNLLSTLRRSERTRDGQGVEANLDLWCRLKQARAELRLAFARAALVVGDSDDMLMENDCQGTDSIHDVRENPFAHDWGSHWQSRADVGDDTHTLLERQSQQCPRLCHGLGTEDATNRVLWWLERFELMFERVQGAVNELAGNQARKLRHERGWSRKIDTPDARRRQRCAAAARQGTDIECEKQEGSAIVDQHSASRICRRWELNLLNSYLKRSRMCTKVDMEMEYLKL